MLGKAKSNSLAPVLNPKLAGHFVRKFSSIHASLKPKPAQPEPQTVNNEATPVVVQKREQADGDDGHVAPSYSKLMAYRFIEEYSVDANLKLLPT